MIAAGSFACKLHNLFMYRSSMLNHIAIWKELVLDDVKCQSLTTRTIALNMSCNKNATFYFTKKNDRCDFFFFFL